MCSPVDVTENSAPDAEQEKPKIGRPFGSKNRAPYCRLRPKGVLASLSDERKILFHQWLSSPQLTYRQICQRIKAEWGLQV
jgi:hypothetical protein